MSIHPKPAPPQRSASLLTVGGQRLLTLTVGAETVAYRLEPCRCGYRLHKADRGTGTAETYETAPGGPCSCPGYRRWRRCKHAAAIGALVRAGRLPRPEACDF